MRVVAERWLAQHPGFKDASIKSLSLLAPIEATRNTLYKASLAPSGYVIFNGNDALPVVQFYSEAPDLPASIDEEDPFYDFLTTSARDNEALCADSVKNPNKDFYVANKKAWRALLETPQVPSNTPRTFFLRATAQSGYTTNIGPLVRSNWYQNLPLSYFNPIHSGGGENGGLVIGCTATAMSMLFDANRWPTYGKGILEHDFF